MAKLVSQFYAAVLNVRFVHSFDNAEYVEAPKEIAENGDTRYVVDLNTIGAGSHIFRAKAVSPLGESEIGAVQFLHEAPAKPMLTIVE